MQGAKAQPSFLQYLLVFPPGHNLPPLLATENASPKAAHVDLGQPAVQNIVNRKARLRTGPQPQKPKPGGHGQAKYLRNEQLTYAQPQVKGQRL